MRIAQALSTIEHLQDLPLLVATLGHEPLWEDLPRVGWCSGDQWARPARVGRAGGFTWYAVEAPDPEACARRVATRLATRGEPAGIIALDPAARLLTLAAGVEDRAAHLTIDLSRPSRLATACLARMSRHEATATAMALTVGEALAGQHTGRAFFRGFREALDRLSAAMAPGSAARDARAVALVQLTRVLFLYFVQSRGWLDGREHFLREELDQTLRARRGVHRGLLCPLFFGTLNTPSAERSHAARRFGRVPFLNGGLFEPHPLERRWPHGAPDAAWRAVFDDLFERFHFTVVEGTAGPAVAPDMLGRVFEGLMAPATRRRSGTFYTPAALVDRMVARTFEDHFEGRATALADLAGLTVLDPAVGSGAFLLGALEHLARLRRAAGDRCPAVRRRILPGLFGVDRDPMAVRLAELRLWLAVLSEQGDVPPSAVEPLPNLDCLVRQGDSLADPAGAMAVVPPRQVALALRDLRTAALSASGASKRRTLDALARAEHAVLESALAQAEQRAEGDIRALLAQARAPTLFAGRAGLDVTGRRQLRALLARRRSVRSLRRASGTGSVPWFRYECQFADVFAQRGGFDLVIGNPPWVRPEALPVDERERLRHRFHWWRGGGPGAAHQPDLAVAFLERAWELAAPEGTVGLLMPAKLLTAGYATRTRAALVREGTVHRAARVAEAPGERFEAAAYPMALVASKRRAGDTHLVASSLDAAPRGGTPQATLGAAPWVLMPEDSRRVRDRLKRGPRLADQFQPRLGVKTGANAIFLDPPASVPPRFSRPAVRGRDLRPFRAVSRHRLLWPHDDAGAVLSEIPPEVEALLAPHRRRLMARADMRASMPWWSLFRTEAGVTGPRVAWADLAPALRAASLEGGVVPLNSCYVIHLPTPSIAGALAAWLNSSWCTLLARAHADPARGGYSRFSARPVGELPLPPSVLTDPRLLSIASDPLAADAPDAIDACVADLLELDANDQRALRAMDRDGAAARR